jgi:hypothetical protein
MVKILKTTNAMENSSDLMKKLARNLETPSRQWYMWVAFLSVIVLFGVYALIRQIQEGQIITGMRDNAVVMLVPLFPVPFNYSGFNGLSHC